ncbi:MAG: hypothetical protein IKM75_08695 [Bacteroidales bacterium]|nr:hypothetical protein [Bacteroidales bacterium]
MCYKRFLILAVLCPLMLLASCGKKADEPNAPTRWGKENYYDKFLWKKHVPDTLYRTIKFDFNQDAKNYMDKPLRLGLFKKTDRGKMLPVTENEMEVFVDGQKCPQNIIDVQPGTDQLKVGIVFKPEAENKVHHWFFRAIDDGGLERINDMDPDTYKADNASLMDIEVDKNKVMNPLAMGTALTTLLLLAALLVWLFVMKAIFFPTFRVGKIQLSDPVPYNTLKRMRGYRKMILTNKQPKQGYFDKVFAGKILYEVNDLWTSEVVIEPKDRNSVRLRCPKDFMADARVLKKNQEYTIQNMTTGKKTTIKIS